MRPLLVLTTALALGCTQTAGDAELRATPVWVRSHNRSAVDVYLLCGDRDARWLGEIGGMGSDALEIPPGQPYCAPGLNFFLVHRLSERGYWVGPFRCTGRDLVELVIEKYAGLSSARVSRDVTY
jgi:hypothetical protein